MPKQIVVLTYGTRGDVQPFVALGVGLKKVGYAVRIAAPGAYREFVQTRGLEFAPLPGDPSELATQLVDFAGLNPLRMVKSVGEFVMPLAIETLSAARVVCQGADAIIHSFLMTDAGHHIALEMGIPDLSGQFFPVFTSTGDFPGMTFPNFPLGRGYRRATHSLTTSIFRYSGRILYVYLRHKRPELPKLGGWSFTRKNRARTPIIYAISPHVLPRPADWPNSAVLTGYWTLDPSSCWNPPQELVAFLSTGTPPIFHGLGSVPIRHVQHVGDVFIKAIGHTNQLAVIAIKGSKKEQFEDLEHVLCVDDIPHSWLFPRMKAVIHHGGAGTTAAGLAAGIPNIVIPFASDQAFWGERVYHLGAGPPPINRKQLTPQRLTQALDTAINHEGVRKQAQKLGNLIRNEDGVAKAVEFISNHINNHTKSCSLA